MLEKFDVLHGGSTSSCIENELEMTKLRDRTSKKERVATKVT